MRSLNGQIQNNLKVNEELNVETFAKLLLVIKIYWKKLSLTIESTNNEWG